MNSALILEQNIKNKIILISKILLTEENFQKKSLYRACRVRNKRF